MKIKADWLQNPFAIAVIKALQNAGFETYFVGGCVRNALLQAPATDIDVATAATPQAVIDTLSAQNIRTIPTGIDHGTVTAISSGTPIEITTYRTDITTDGRHAQVEFSTSIVQDAQRRDFTMNALYADLDGTVIDPLSGLPDLQNRSVRFIKNPQARVREDYLRILRYFRFHAIYGDLENGFDPDALDACARNIDGLASLSKERIGQEMRKLLAAHDPTPSIATMAKIGVLPTILPHAIHSSLAPLIHLEQVTKTPPSWLRRLASMNTENTKDMLRLSKIEARNLRAITQYATTGASPKSMGYHLGAEYGLDAFLIFNAHMTSPVTQAMIKDIQLGAQAQFPIRAADAPSHLVGAKLGAWLKQLETAWVQSEFTLSKSALLDISPTKG